MWGGGEGKGGFWGGVGGWTSVFEEGGGERGGLVMHEFLFGWGVREGRLSSR